MGEGVVFARSIGFHMSDEFAGEGHGDVLQARIISRHTLLVE
jgi:hypothetical protein